MPVLMSGVKPTGQLHLGNYLGALQAWVELQEQYRCFFGIMDLHSLTISQKPEERRQLAFEAAIDLLALGIDPHRSTLFVQSHVPAHSQLAWIIDCHTPLAELQRMTQFKDKSERDPKNINAGLLTYPSLMAADMLVYRAEVVPVGEDQLQHLELARLAARKLNHAYGLDLPEPKAHLLKPLRVMSLLNPEKKMSKDLGAASYVALRDEPEAIKRKVAKAVTGGGHGLSTGVKNLLDLLRSFADASVFKQYEAAAKADTLQYSELKQVLSGAIASHFAAYREKVKELEAKPKYVHEVLADGAKKANAVASKTLAEISEKVGLI
jgi:tryptophanyl-tRNA synthetase